MNKDVKIWNSDWLNPNLKTIIENEDIINRTEQLFIGDVVQMKEIDIFSTEYHA